MSVNPNWTFNDLINNIERLKEEYIFFLAFFSCSNTIEAKRLNNLYIKSIRDLFYSINIDDRQIDVAWEFMNDYICYPDLIYYRNQLDRRKKKC